MNLKYLNLFFFLLIPVYLIACSEEKADEVNNWSDIYISQLNDKKEVLECLLNSSTYGVDVGEYPEESQNILTSVIKLFDATIAEIKLDNNKDVQTSEIKYYLDIADQSIIDFKNTQITSVNPEIPAVKNGFNRYGHQITYSFTENKFKLVDEYKLMNVSGWQLNKLPEDMFTICSFQNPSIGNNSTSKLFTYKVHDNYSLQLEVDVPNGEGPFPFMIWIHGGGWESGDYTAFNYMSRYFADRGIAGVRISYSLLPQGGKMPIAWQDIQDALVFVQGKAGELKLKSDLFGFIGHSAGAHLSAYAAMRTPGTKLLVGINGAYDLNAVKPKYEPNDHHFQFLGQTYEARYEASPINFVHSGAPHTLLTYGSGDFYVDPDQITNFAAKLRASGVSVETLTKEYCSHSAFIGNSEEFIFMLSKLSEQFNQHLK